MFSPFAAVVLTSSLGCHGTSSVPREHERFARDAVAILDHYVEVTGGATAYAGIQNRVTEVRVTHVGMDFEDRVVTYEARPDRMRSFSTSEELGTTESGIDGGLVWFVSENTGPVIEQGEAREAAIAAAAFDRSARWREHFTDAAYVGDETIGGTSCQRVVLTPRVGRPETRYYDKASGLLVKIAKTRLTSVGMRPTIPVELLIDDYRPVGGLLVAHKVTEIVDMCGTRHETVYVTERIEQNVPLPAHHFDPPDEVIRFARRQAAAGHTARPGCNLRKHPTDKQAVEGDGIRP